MSENTSEEPTNTQNENTQQSVDPNVLDQYKNDMFKYKREAQRIADEKAQLEARIQQIENEKLENQGNYKKLWEETQQQADEYKGKYEGVINSVIEDKKLSAVREFALKKNIRKEALDDLDMVDLSPVVVETTSSGRYNVHGADQFIEKLYSSKPHWFQDQKAPNVNNATGDFEGNEKTYSIQEVRALEKKDPTLYREIVTKKRHLIRS